MKPSIVVNQLGKAYKQYPRRGSRLLEWVLPFCKPRHTLKWVLQDVSFTVNPGEAIGIIGVNGAGKSTLLKMITGTVQPTAGSVEIQGRVAAMLELGMGFHPEFTGRQNVFMAGQLAGLRAEDINALMPEIEAFAGIGEYFDQPVRIYSSGMQARVAFSVSTATKPDILIVDEILSVGDIAFQAKCMQRMKSLLKQGTTLLFVSHALNQVRQFCQRALYLSDGVAKAWGSADKVCDLYQNDLSGATQLEKIAEKSGLASKVEVYSRERDLSLRKNSVGGDAGGTLDLEFLNFKVLDAQGLPVTSCRSGALLRFRATIQANQDVPAGATVGLLVADKTGYHLMACNTNYYDKCLSAMQKGEHVFVEWKLRIPFASGEFRVDIGIKPEPLSTVFYDRVFCAATLAVITDVMLLKRNFGGYLFVDADVEITTPTSHGMS